MRTTGCGASGDEDGEFGVARLVAARVDQQPDVHAVREPSSGRTVTYRQLWQRSGALAADLVRAGVRPGDVVAVAEERSIGLVAALLAIVRVGGVYLPMDSYAPADRLVELLDDAGVQVVVTSAESKKWSALPARLRRVGLLPFDSFDRPGRSFVDVDAGGDDPMYVNYTSGSTGRPKGVLVPHRAVVRLVSCARFCTIEPGDRVANASNPAFDATTFELWNTLTAGGTIVVFPAVTELRIDDWMALVAAEGISAMFLTTSLFHMVARERPAAFAGLKTLIVGGEQLDLVATQRVLAHGAPGRLVNGYGPTETTTFASYFDCMPENLAGLGRIPIGFPLQGTTLNVLDDELRPVEPGQTGELCIGGSGVALGYLNRPALTAERFVEEPGARGALMYRTDDLARQLPSGAIELLGRRDRQVKLRGFRIELEEIEHAIIASGLADSAFVEKIGDGPAAFLAGFVLPKHSVEAATLPHVLGQTLGQTLPDYMVPARWLVLSELPYGPTGKIDRTRLIGLVNGPDVAATNKTTNQLTSEASDDADLALASVRERVETLWRNVLGVATVEPNDNFVDVGGNSILAIQFASRLRERLAVDLEPTDVLLASSLAELVDRVIGERPSPPESLVF